MSRKLEHYVWGYVKEATYHHLPAETKQKYRINSSDLIYPEIKTNLIFPQNNPENRNRLAYVLFDCFENLNRELGIHMTITYAKRSEYFTFPTLEAIWDYFMDYIEYMKGATQ
jgi:hypothetical protein